MSGLDRSFQAARQRPRLPRPDPGRRRGQPRQLRRAAPRPQRPGRRHRDGARQPDQGGRLHRDRPRRADRRRRRRRRPARVLIDHGGGDAVGSRSTNEHDTGRPDGAPALRGQEGHRRPGPPARADGGRPARPRSSPRRGGAGPGQDDGDQGARPVDRRRVQADPVHAGPRPRRPRRDADLQPEDRRVHDVARAGVHEPPPGRRDQPRAGQGPERAPRGHAGAAGHDRPRDPRRCPNPFLVLATQNPIETEGTYALPEAQVDRFMLKVLVGYPTPDRGVRDRRADDRPAGPDLSRSSRPTSSSGSRRPSTGSTSTRPWSSTRSGWPTRPGARTRTGCPSSSGTSPTARARGHRST